MPKSINLDNGFFTHPKTVRLITLAGEGSEARLIQLWTYVADHRPGTGGFDDWTPEEVEVAADWKGEKGLFVDSLVSVGWIHKKEGNGKSGFFMHNWRKWQPHLVKYAKVSSERKKAADTRWDKEKKRGKYKSKKELDGDANGMQKRNFACANLKFCNANAVQCNAITTISPLSPSELEAAAARIADHYSDVGKPKGKDKSGSRKVFIATLKAILTKGTAEECLIRSIDNYAVTVCESEKSPDDIVYRFGLQTFFGPKNEHWKDYIVRPGENEELASADALNAVMAECEAKVADTPDWSPVGMFERMKDKLDDGN